MIHLKSIEHNYKNLKVLRPVRESEKDQRTTGRDQKYKRQTSKKIFAFAWCGHALTLTNTF